MVSPGGTKHLSDILDIFGVRFVEKLAPLLPAAEQVDYEQSIDKLGAEFNKLCVADPRWKITST